LHFWVQVKSSVSESFRKLKQGKYSYKFKTSHLQYWKAQPVPVFVFLLPDINEQSASVFNIYVINITEYLLTNKIGAKKSQTIRTNNHINTIEKLENLVYKIVDITTARQRLNLGILSPTPSSQDQYVKHVYPVHSALYADKILKTIRSSSSFVIGELIELEKQNPNDQNFVNNRRKFASILKALEICMNWEVHYYLGLSYEQDGDKKAAKKFFEKALKIIRTDKNINQNEWNLTTEMIIAKINHT
jgi:hypothetical protein